MLKLLHRIRFTQKSLFIFLIWLGLLAFGIMVPFMGVFADDWPFLYVEHLAGYEGVVNFISWVRPFGAYLFALVSSLFGQHLWAYHIFLLIMRVVDAVLFYWILKLLWPKQTLPAVWAAALMVVFPSFKQQPLAVEYAPHFITLGLLFFSMAAMIMSVKKGKLAWLWRLVSIVSAFNIFFVEYFVGLEVLRPIFIWIALGHEDSNRRQRIKITFISWLPYIVIGLLFLVWRVFGLGFVSFQPELIDDSSLSMSGKILALIPIILKDILTVTFGTWIQIFSFPAGKRALLMYGALVTITFISVVLYLLRFDDKNSQEKINEVKPKAGLWQINWIVIGFFSMLMAGWPFWITKIPLSLDFPYDRVTLSFIPGACLVAAGIIGLLKFRKIQTAILGVLISLSIGLHFQNANDFRKEWDVFKSFFWQLTWRAPALKEGTILSMDNQAFDYHVDKFYAPLINWTYFPEQKDTDVPVYIFDFYKLWERYNFLEETNIPIETTYGTIHFEGSSDDLLLIAYNPPGCLRVLKPDDHGLIEVDPALLDSL